MPKYSVSIEVTETYVVEIEAEDENEAEELAEDYDTDKLTSVESRVEYFAHEIDSPIVDGDE